jgi:hypothetical protein
MVIPIFTAFAYFTPYPISRLGAGLIVIFGFFAIFKLWHTRRQKNKIDYTTSLKQQLITAKSYVEKEKRLLSTILYWYILPFFIGGILFTAGRPMIGPWFLGFFILSNILVSGHIWRMNRRTVKKQLNPLIEEIDNTLQELEAS